VIQQSTYGANDSGHPAGGELPHEDFTAMLKCLKIFGGSVIVSGIVYLFVRNLTIAAGICGGVSVLLTLYHTPVFPAFHRKRICPKPHFYYQQAHGHYHFDKLSTAYATFESG
jgi:hypothetical protein